MEECKRLQRHLIRFRTCFGNPVRSGSENTLSWEHEARAKHHIGMGFWLWRRRYQQGLRSMCGNKECTQDTETSGCRASNWYSILPFFCGMAYRRSIVTFPNAGAALGLAMR